MLCSKFLCFLNTLGDLYRVALEIVDNKNKTKCIIVNKESPSFTAPISG